MSMKKYTFGGQKGKNRPSEPKNGIWGPKSVWSCDIYNISIDRDFYIEQEKIFFRGSERIIIIIIKAKISFQSPKTEFGAQNQYDLVIHPSIEIFT
jgi:hypothetical protein